MDLKAVIPIVRLFWWFKHERIVRRASLPVPTIPAEAEILARHSRGRYLRKPFFDTHLLSHRSATSNHLAPLLTRGIEGFSWHPASCTQPIHKLAKLVPGRSKGIG